MPPPKTILGVDPGARETGLVLTYGDRLLGHRLAIAPDVLDMRNPVDPVYLELVIATTEELLDETATEAVTPSGADLLAIEAVHPPNGHLGMTNVAGALGLAAVTGALIGWAQGEDLPVMAIDTDGHGQGPLLGYPKDLVGPMEKKGTGVLRHCRSAYDVALAARWHLNVQRGRRT